jgi:hypothetical protein
MKPTPPALAFLRQSAAFLPLIEIAAFESPYRTFLLDNEE